MDRLEGSVHYHVPVVYGIRGGLVDVDLLEASFRLVMERHEVLRSVVVEREGEGYQRVMGTEGWTLGRHRLGIGDDVDRYIEILMGKPFDLSSDYMLRADLLQRGEGKDILVLTLHHIAFDGWSWGILMGELDRLYGSIVDGLGTGLAELPVQYGDYAVWQREQVSGAYLQGRLKYWKDRLEGLEPLLLPTDKRRPLVQSTRGGHVYAAIPAHILDGVRKMCVQEGVTPYMFYLTVFQVLLYRYSGQSDICVGSPIAGRIHEETERLIGFFVNTLAIRSTVDGEEGFLALLSQVKENILGAYEYQDVPFEKIVEAVAPERDLGRTPLFQVMFTYEDSSANPERPLLGGLELEQIPSGVSSSKFDLTFTVGEKGEEGVLGIEYCSDLYHRASVERMLGHYLEILVSAVVGPDTKVGLLRMLTEAEEAELSRGLGYRKAPYPRDKTIVDLFRETAQKYGDCTALVSGEHRLSYSELDQLTDRLASHLYCHGVGRESLVGICMDRTEWLIVGILGILKAGGAYVPLDPDYPVDRLSYMVKDTGLQVTICDTSGRTSLVGIDGLDLVDGTAPSVWHADVPPVLNAPVAEDLAYVIYTSGSTGRPKGVMIEHR
ncbi:condensation domain-containing protein, partial [Olivibacter sp. CPCC 100613]|uniref:non-ribosomal peptide synthetase n=1 Tax=Olivibacter sp. CPCC 100613 TaxID=3079931 RepID=UPI002FF9C0CB